ncbi:MAG: aldo/keto reductase [Thermoanaerobaculia bacterium]
MSKAPERIELAPGYSIARVIVGCWQLAAGHGGRWERATVLRELEALVDAGYTTFDCADIYTGVEELLGELVRRVGSDRIQVHTKYVPDRSSLADLRAADVRAAIDRSLARLGVDRLDLVQLHWWDWTVPGWSGTAATLESLRREGKIRCLGVTNTDVEHLRAILDDGVEVVANQVQYSLLDRRPEHGMRALCAARGLRLLCYGSLAGGFLGERWRGAPPPAEPLANRSLVKYRLIVEEVGGWDALQALLERLAEVAARRGVGPAAAAVRWVLDRPAVGAVIVGAGLRTRLDEMEGLWSLHWSDEERSTVDAAIPGSPPGDVFDLERVPGGRHTGILRTELHGEET